MLETIVDGHRVDFHFGRQSALPVRVDVYSWEAAEPRDRLWYSYELSDYRAVEGIVMPHSVVEDRGRGFLVFLYCAGCEFNVPVADGFFDRLSKFAAGRDAWRKRLTER